MQSVDVKVRIKRGNGVDPQSFAERDQGSIGKIRRKILIFLHDSDNAVEVIGCFIVKFQVLACPFQKIPLRTRIEAQHVSNFADDDKVCDDGPTLPRHALNDTGVISLALIE